MSEPKRIQLRRTKGWRKPEGAIVVARPSRWGNPYKVGSSGSAEECVAKYRTKLTRTIWTPVLGGITPKMVKAELAGHDLACWCPLDQPCHADVLLELANPQPLTMEERDG